MAISKLAFSLPTTGGVIQALQYCRYSVHKTLKVDGNEKLGGSGRRQ